LLAALFVGRIVLQVAVLYVWLAFSFSRFDATRPYTERLTGFVITPLFSLAERLLSALPLGLLALVSGVVVYVVVRFIELFFANVRRGETRVTWLSADLVLPVSVMARVGVVLLALVFAGPLVTGDPEGSLARAGSIVMLALAFATTPLLASVVVGIMQVFSRRVRIGQELELSGRRGRVTAVGLFDLRLRDEAGFEVRVPHLMALLAPLRTRGPDARTFVSLCVASSTQPSAVKALLLATANTHGDRAQVELQDVDASGARFAISVTARAELSASDLRILLVEALQGAGMALGHGNADRAYGDRSS
jgi:small-conductance mechanosensitive channel